jgi:GH25 family lysozyme M1 (1,4-beta-N-acetylmuramidase)
MGNNTLDRGERRGVRNTQNIISIIFLSLVALMALSFSIVLLIRNANLQRQEDAVQSELDALNSEGYYTEIEAQKLVENAKIEAEESTKNSIRQMIQERLENGDSATTAIRALFPDQIVVANAGRYYFFPITDEIEHHGFSEEDFEVNDKGFLEYVGDDSTVESKAGIDVSRFQGEIQWDKVADAGVEFAIIRVGFRGSTEGKLILDDFFEDNIKGATQNGIKVGVYFYSQAVSPEEAKEEAQMLLDAIEPYQIDYPVVIDVEYADSDTARTAELTSDEYEAAVEEFCSVVEQAGYKAMVYGNVTSFTLLMDAADVDKYDTWIAYYGTPLYYPYHFNIWQYSKSGKIDGIDGEVDLNICITDY